MLKNLGFRKLDKAVLTLYLFVKLFFMFTEIVDIIELRTSITFSYVSFAIAIVRRVLIFMDELHAIRASHLIFTH